VTTAAPPTVGRKYAGTFRQTGAMSTELTVLISAGAGICASLLGAIVGARFSGATARELDGLARRRDEEHFRAGVQAAELTEG